MGSLVAPITVHEHRRAERADGPATVLAIGTANPANCVTQLDYADFYCRVTNSEHLAGIKDKLDTLCVSASGSEKRFFHHTEEMINAHPEFLDRATPSLDARLQIAAAAVPELAATAAARAVVQWGRPATDITHLVVTTNAGAHAPGADVRFAALLGLRPTLTVLTFRGPDCPHTVNCQALFGDGAGAVIVGADAVRPVEQPMFEMVSASQTLIPGTEHVITMQLTEDGLDGNIDAKELAPLAANNVKKCLSDALTPLGLDGGEWNDLFWAVHPGSPLILDHIESTLQLKPGKLAASRRVLREYGNMLGSTLIFVLDEQRRRMEEEGDGAEWGVMLGFGPGFTIETMVLHAPDHDSRKKN
uniref:Chalcone synthase n=1 Tax=Oryza glumipatula TaxID=40148 RepID=A0A0E0AKR6_9ORYZ